MKKHLITSFFTIAITATLNTSPLFSMENPPPEAASYELRIPENQTALWQRYHQTLESLAQTAYDDITFEANRLNQITPNFTKIVVFDIDDTLLLSTDSEHFLTQKPAAQIDACSRPVLPAMLQLYHKLTQNEHFAFNIVFLTSRDASFAQETYANLQRCGFDRTPQGNLWCLPREREPQYPQPTGDPQADALAIEQWHQKLSDAALEWKIDALLHLQKQQCNVIAFFDDDPKYFSVLETAAPGIYRYHMPTLLSLSASSQTSFHTPPPIHPTKHH